MRRFIALALGVTFAVSLPAWSQPLGPPPEHQHAVAGHHHAPADASPPVSWDSLSPHAREMLAPLQDKWAHMSPRHQQHLLQKAHHWESMPPQRREEIRQRIRRWQQMSPAEREQARANRRVYHHLTPKERDQLHAAYERFQNLPPAERQRLRAQWHKLKPAQRKHWIEHGAHGDLPKPAGRPSH